jgi:hypothetical protein
MATALRNRIEKLEAKIAPRRANQGIVTLFAPKPDAPADEWSRHRAEVEQARRQNELVIVVSFVHPSRTQGAPGVVYVPNEFEARLESLSATPSQHGNGSALDDALQALSGNIIGPIAGASPERDGFDIR